MRNTRLLLPLFLVTALVAGVLLPSSALRAGTPAPADSQVTFIAAERTRAAFAKGMPLVETDRYKVHASRREAPGMAEVHTRDTDIIYVLDGSATVVTGGRTIDPQTTAPDEIRGKAIEGGVAQRLVKGDMLIVPNGVPHWFKAVDGPLLYYVVKTTADGEVSSTLAPLATVDLGTREGTALVRGDWRYRDAQITEVDFRGPGPDGQPTGGAVKTYDYVPKAGAADYDDRQWQVIEPTTLSARRGNGRLSFNWYRINITVPERVDGFDPTGSTITLETTVDDYAEIWVDGELPRALGQRGGSVIAGWNAPNRVVVGRDVKPGQKIQLAIFGSNGPLSNPPANFIFIREARLHFARGPRGPVAVTPQEVNVDVIRNDAAIDAIVGPNPKAFKLAEGFQFTEGPVWDASTGALLFSDPNSNIIYKYANDALSVFRTPSGYSGADIAEYKQPGSNGLAFDASGRLTVNEHGNRRVSRLESDGGVTVLADRYDGRRLNSPNDLVYRSDGALFMTDPPFGLPKAFADPRKELSYSGVYALINGTLRLVSSELSGPNGIAFSPDERTLYVGNWDEKRKVVMAYEIAPDGSSSRGRVFFDMTAAPGEDAIDGIKVDQNGNVYVSGPGGLWVLSPNGKHLGTIVLPRHVHNMAWGGPDGRTLYLCARDRLYRMPLNVPGSAHFSR
jgi:gluconolactonase